MQQNSEQRRGTFGTGLFVSAILHVGFAAALLFQWPITQPEPEKEETVKVEMVQEPEKKPELEKKSEPEKKPEPEKKVEPVVKPTPETKPQEKPEPQPKGEEAKPAEKQAEKTEEKPPAKAEEQPAKQQPGEKQIEEAREPAGRSPPQAFESAAKEGGKEAGGDRPSEPEKMPDTEPQVDRVLPPAGQQTPQKTEPDLSKPQDKPVETRDVAKLPELELPESVNPSDTLNEGEALIENVPTPQARPKDIPAVSQATVQELAAANVPASDTRSSRPPSELKKARELYSENTLSDPRIRQALGQLPRERRIVQMCMIETLEQVRRTRPDTVPQGLFFDPRDGSPISGQVMTAMGAAYKISGGWIDVDFKCTVNADADGITAFSFAVGGSVPKSQWQARRFPKN